MFTVAATFRLRHFINFTQACPLAENGCAAGYFPTNTIIWCIEHQRFTKHYKVTRPAGHDFFLTRNQFRSKIALYL